MVSQWQLMPKFSQIFGLPLVPPEKILELKWTPAWDLNICNRHKYKRKATKWLIILSYLWSNSFLQSVSSLRTWHSFGCWLLMWCDCVHGLVQLVVVSLILRKKTLFQLIRRKLKKMKGWWKTVTIIKQNQYGINIFIIMLLIKKQNNEM